VQRLLHDLDGIVWVLDAASGAYTYVSEGIQRLLGYSPEDWLQDPGFRADRLHPDDREAAENDLTHALRAAKPCDAGVDEANRKLVLARQVHTDLVRDALAVRDRRLVRMLGLTRRHPAPRFFDIDSPVPDEPV